jgi:hypothetical protein
MPTTSTVLPPSIVFSQSMVYAIEEQEQMKWCMWVQ